MKAFSWFFGGKPVVSRQASRGGQFRPMVESLESRRVLATLGYTLDQGALFIVGTNDDDQVQVVFAPTGSPAGGGAFYDRDMYVVIHQLSSDPGAINTAGFELDQVRAIIFNGNAGDDQFINRTNINLLAHGGPGNDTIYGGVNGNAEIHGDGDNDTLIGTRVGNKIYGGPGEDVLFGLEGNDVLFGGPDQDILHGYEGADVMFGGTSADKLFGGPDPDFVDGGRDFTPDVLGGEWSDNFADRASDVFVKPANETTHFVYTHTEDRTMLDSERDYEAQFASNPGSIWGLLGIVSSGYTIDDVGISFEFAAEDHDISLIEPDWATEVLPVDDYFVEMAALDLESLEDVSWGESSAAEQAVLNDVALLALLADELPSVSGGEPPAESEELVEYTDALEVDPLFADEPEFSDNELLETDISLFANESTEEPAGDEPTAESPPEDPIAEETYTYESYINSWSRFRISSNWARFWW
jgi:Ca2+-binding RTX toxin-like protein